MRKLFISLLCLITTQTFAANRLPIIQLGHPTLRQTAKELTAADFSNPNFQAFIDDMIYTMGVAGGVGLAAPQVNQSFRLFVMKSFPGVPLTVVINPVVEYIEEAGTKSSTEGCLSIPGRSLTVKRFKEINISYYDRTGKHIAKRLTGFGAIIAQHEYDHLNGVLIVDLVEQMFSELNFEEYFKAPLM